MSPTERLGPYELVQRLATGGMGEVFLAQQSGPGGFSRTVVVKRLLPHLASDPAFVQMFVNEARVVSQLSHPNIAQVFDFGEVNGTYFMSLELVRGRTLQQVMKALKARQRLPGPPVVVELLVQTLGGLQHAHTLKVAGRPNPVVHRDMSPDNILVGFDGRARIIDFGIARAADIAPTTRTGTMKGKFAYMAPERFAEHSQSHVDPRLDVYSMGVVAYECLTGVRPFRGSTDAALIGAILNSPCTPARELNPAVPEALSDLVMRALDRSPARRFGSALELRGALEAWAAANGGPAGEQAVSRLMSGLFDGEGAVAVNTNVLDGVDIVEEAPPRGRRAWWGAAAAALALGAGALLAARWSTTRLDTAPPPPHLEAPRPPEAQAPTPPTTTPPQDPPRAEAPARGVGRVVFRVKPWGEVWLKDEKLGVTPNVRVERPAGRYTFTVKHPDYAPREVTVELSPDVEVVTKVDLTAGR